MLYVSPYLSWILNNAAVKSYTVIFQWKLRKFRTLIDFARLVNSPPAPGLSPQVHSSPLFRKPFPSLGLSPPLLFLRWRGRLGKRRRHLSCLRPALRRRRAHPPGMPATSLSFCCARRSTPNPNKTICIRIWFQLQYKPTNFDFVCKNYRVYMCTPMSYAGPAPVTVFRLMCVLVEFRNANFQNHWFVLIKDQWITTS